MSGTGPMLLALSVLVATLAACGAEAGDSASGASATTSAAATTAAAAPAIRRQAGKWSTTVELLSFDMPGAGAMGAQMKDQMQQRMRAMVPKDQCLTAAQVAAEDPTKIFQTGFPGQCRFSRKSVSGPKVDIAGSCEMNGGMKVDLTITGTQSPTQVEGTSTTIMTIPGAPGPTKTVMRTRSQRIGAC